MAKILALKLLSAIGVILCFASPSWAEIRTITATGEYRMGDHDTRADAKRIALQDAKRLALEKAGTYLENVTEIKNFQLDRDEIRAYTAGIVEVTEQQTRSTMEGETTVVRVEVTCRIDTDVVARQIDALRKNETVKAELLQARQETDRLRKELDANTRELSAVTSKTETETIAQARRMVLTGQDVNSLLTQAWVALAGSSGDLLAGSSSTEGRQRARSLTEQALALDASNPDVHVAMGSLLAEEGNINGAIAAYRTAIRLQPDDAIADSNLGVALAAKGDLEGAIAAYRTAIRLRPDYADAHYNLGIALKAKGRKVEAAREFREYVRLAPDTPANRQQIEKARAKLRGLE